MSTIILKDHTRDERLELSYHEVKKVTVVSLTSAQIERQDGTAITYDLGIDGIRRLKDWVISESADPDPRSKFRLTNPASNRQADVYEIDAALEKFVARYLGVHGETGRQAAGELRTIMYALSYQAYEGMTGVNQMAFYASKLGVPYKSTRNNERDLDWFARALNVPVEKIRRDLDLPPITNAEQQSIARAALEDLVSHGANMLGAIDHRIERAKDEDKATGRKVGPGEAPQGPTDANESYWKHEREVLSRMMRQALYALGRSEL